MVVDTRITRPVDLPPRSIQYCWPSRPATFVPGPGNLRRWEIKLLPGEQPEEFGRHENVVQQIARFVDPSCVEIWRSAVYRFHALLAERWRHGRVFLLGDACHQTPPFLGQGMCAGIRDAGNLAWKLAMVLQDGAPDALLDSYEQERKPHVRTLVATAKEFGLIIGELDPGSGANPRRDVARPTRARRGRNDPPALCPQSHERGHRSRSGGARRRHPVRAAEGPAPARRDAQPANGPSRRSSPVSLPHRATSAEAQTWLTPESRELWRRLGGERIVIGSADQTHRPDGDAGNDVQYLTETDALFATWMSQHGSAAVVVRPDRYVFGMANDAAQLNRLVAAVARHVLGLA